MKHKKINLKILIASFLIIYFFAFIGSIFTSSSVNTGWYDSVRVSLTPPNWVFPLVWNILFFLIALSLYFSFFNAKERNLKIKIGILFGINLSLNAFWSFLFFYLRNPLYAFIDLIFIWFSILSMILVVRKVNKKISYLLIPYLLWVTFAGILNLLIIIK